MLVRIKYTRNGLNTSKNLKNTKRPHLMKRCQKPKRLTRSENGVENSKGLSLRNGQKPVRGCLAGKRCRKPKRPLAAKRFECKTPFEFDIAFAVFIPLRVCV